MVQAEVVHRRRRHRRISTSPSRCPVQNYVDGRSFCDDVASVSSSLSADCSDHSFLVNPSKKRRLELDDNVDDNGDCSKSFTHSDDDSTRVVTNEQPVVLMSCVSTVEDSVASQLMQSSSSPALILGGSSISYENIVSARMDPCSPLDWKDRSASVCVAGHLVTPVPSHSDLLLLSKSTTKLPLQVASKMVTTEVACSDFGLDTTKSIVPHTLHIDMATITEDRSALVRSVKRKGPIVRFLYFLILMSTIVTVNVLLPRSPSGNAKSTSLPPPIQVNSVYITGGGFSGFWFTLGRLQGLISDRSASKELYCYSSGCLAVVAALSHYSMEEMWNIAYNIQYQWKIGQISRYDVVPAFVDELLYGPGRHRTNSNSSLYEEVQSHDLRLQQVDLSSLHIITTVKDGWWGMKTSIRTPDSVVELRAMLIQTTWIPFAIGGNLWYEGHMDGAFTTQYHPSCEHTVGLELDWDLYANVLNVNLGRDRVENFWNKGVTFGL